MGETVLFSEGSSSKTKYVITAWVLTVIAALSWLYALLAPRLIPPHYAGQTEGVVTRLVEAQIPHADTALERESKFYEVEYQYSVSGTRYTSTVFEPDAPSPTPQHRINLKMPGGRGDTVKVYYNPSDPKDAALEPGATGLRRFSSRSLTRGATSFAILFWVIVFYLPKEEKVYRDSSARY